MRTPTVKINGYEIDYIEDRTTFDAVRWALRLIDKNGDGPTEACRTASEVIGAVRTEVRFYVFQALYRRQDRERAAPG